MKELWTNIENVSTLSQKKAAWIQKSHLTFWISVPSSVKWWVGENVLLALRFKFNDSKCKSISGMKYCSKHISHGNSMKCKNSSADTGEFTG